MSAITDADVEAAAERIERLTGYDMAHCQEIARAALATIAPRIDAARLDGLKAATAKWALCYTTTFPEDPEQQVYAGLHGVYTNEKDAINALRKLNRGAARYHIERVHYRDATDALAVYGATKEKPYD